MTADAREAAFQKDIIRQMIRGGWQLGKPSGYDPERALYTADCLAYVKNTQEKNWEKYEKLYPADPEKAFLDKLTAQLAKADPQATDDHLRTFGTLGVLRHELRDRSASFKLCQFKPEHGLNPTTQAMYEGNILRVVPELVYSPYATEAHRKATGTKAKRWRIDLVLFVNGIPIVTMELKSEFKQAVDRAIRQYQKTRLPKDPATKKREPLLTFKRGALVHFAVSQYEAHMTTRLDGKDTHFLPFNRGTKAGGAGNDVPDDLDTYATGYLWNEVLSPTNLLQILGHYVHLQIKTEEDWEGVKSKKETLIFPRYHQWDLVRRLIEKSLEEGPGHKYLVQHSAGSGKSYSIAWTAHQLASLHDARGDKLFNTVIVVTDRTVLDDQLQSTIGQFEHAAGVVGHINREGGQASKSEQLARALEQSQPIVIVTLQTFSHVLKAIEDNVSLKERRFAIIADEAHSSQSGRTALKLKNVLVTQGAEESATRTAEDELIDAVAARRYSPNLSYYAFTATPKSKTLELFGRRPDPEQPASKTNKPAAFDVYSMRQAIEEGFILDVLRNYTSYKVGFRLAQQAAKPDVEVDSKKARVKLGRWVRLHDVTIGQKVREIVEHFRGTVMGLLGGQAKAMIVTGSRKEAVRFKLEFDKYVGRKGYRDLRAMVAFSGDVPFSAGDPHSEGLVGEKFTESGMNPGLKGRDLREAFDTADYQVMIAANKFQTGFDQPKLCAMYVDKKLGGVDCVQTLSRLNRKYPGKAETYVVDFFNDPEDVLEAFQEYYQTAELLDVSDPNRIWDLFDKLRAGNIFQWTEVTQFSEVFFSGGKIINITKPAVDRWQARYELAQAEVTKAKAFFDHAKTIADATFIANTESAMKEAQRDVDALDLFKKDLTSFTRYYEFMSQIVDYDSTDLEKLSLYARHLAPQLREKTPDDDPIDLSSVELSHYRLSKIKQQRLRLVTTAETGLAPGDALGTGKPRNQEEEWLSQIIARMNELFSEGTANDKRNYLLTIRDKISENETVMQQIANNAPEQALLGDFPVALNNAVMDSGEAHQNLMEQYLSDPARQDGFRRLIFELLLASV